MKSKVLIASAVLLGASIAVAAPVQAHDSHHDLWPLYGLTGLILYDAYSSNHHHHKHHYYDDHRGRYRYRRDYSYGRPGHKHRHNDYGKSKHRSGR